MLLESLAKAMVIPAIVLAAGPASAGQIAGWDFSQWFSAGVLSTDGLAGSNVLDANYSSLDPTFGAGAESAAFGTLYFDGTNGSTNVVPLGTGTEAFIPSAGSLVSNLDPGVTPPEVPFDTLNVLTAEGQDFANLLSMTANSNVSVVFEADLGANTATDLALSFAGAMISGSSFAQVEFSTDGSTYSPVTSVELTTTDTPFSVALDPTQTSQGFVRLTLEPGALIDNVSIGGTVQLVPEPGTLLLGMVGVAGLWAYSRPRR